MGAMKCNRKGCKQIMCDRYSGVYGYICSSCLEELVKTGARTDIAEFMQTLNVLSKPAVNFPAARARYEVEFSWMGDQLTPLSYQLLK